MNKYQEALDRLQWEENFQKGNEIEILREIVEQYRPPTFDEVVKAWEMAYENQSGLEFNTEQPLRLEVHYRLSPTYRMTKRLAVVDLRSDYIEQGNTSIDYHQAINLTIRYLQAKEKENV
ncbi:hypothetical protein G7059_01710 [Erysipelothrix sp. HDW6A]|uniref:hypothetical protein n=1 Tax=Erysipelothrix sp. HDW6A TaxID=2714928 RepID=UPI00140DA707|nr:hypothetical protein [Erysipelothrix sp. HDW6A]QIK56650.1 hypothetical protein G7059_01710 [Erysipelothrix sp. HDW6A]